MAQSNQSPKNIENQFVTELEFFNVNLENLKNQYPSQYIIIKGDQVIAHFNDKQAIFQALLENEIQLPSIACSTDPVISESTCIHLLGAVLDTKPLNLIVQEMQSIDLSSLEEKMRSRAKTKLDDDEYRAQKISFLYGELHPKYGISREQAQEIADRYR